MLHNICTESKLLNQICGKMLAEGSLSGHNVERTCNGRKTWHVFKLLAPSITMTGNKTTSGHGKSHSNKDTVTTLLQLYLAHERMEETDRESVKK